MSSRPFAYSSTRPSSSLDDTPFLTANIRLNLLFIDCLLLLLCCCPIKAVLTVGMEGTLGSHQDALNSPNPWLDVLNLVLDTQKSLHGAGRALDPYLTPSSRHLRNLSIPSSFP